MKGNVYVQFIMAKNYIYGPEEWQITKKTNLCKTLHSFHSMQILSNTLVLVYL